MDLSLIIRINLLLCLLWCKILLNFSLTTFASFLRQIELLFLLLIPCDFKALSIDLIICSNLMTLIPRARRVWVRLDLNSSVVSLLSRAWLGWSLSKALLQLIDLLSAPLVLCAVVRDEFVQADVALCSGHCSIWLSGGFPSRRHTTVLFASFRCFTWQLALKVTNRTHWIL